MAEGFKSNLEPKPESILWQSDLVLYIVDLETILAWARSMTWKGIQPIVHLSTTTYEKGISLSKKQRKKDYRALERVLIDADTDWSKITLVIVVFMQQKTLAHIPRSGRRVDVGERPRVPPFEDK